MKTHFIGIGGIGVSALAQYYLSIGAQVSGSDLVPSEITDYLSQKGVKVFIGPHSEKNIKEGADLVIYSPAVQSNNPEYVRAKEQNIKLLSYPQALGELTKRYFTIAVSGTHGKSTTTSMIALILEKAGLDPLVIVGTKVREFGNTNFRNGKGGILVIEADEHFASFFSYWPKIIVITNIEREHLDYYKNLGNILKTYGKYIGHLPKDGILILNKDDANSSKLKTQSSKLQFKIQNFSIRQKEAKQLKKILKVPGKHNVYNALAALTVARVLIVPDKTALKALARYRGAWRRFDMKIGMAAGKKITVISDYGHHPTEISATFAASREKFPKKRIVCVFEPHQNQRTYYLFSDFVKAIKNAPVDDIIVTDIYDVAGRETKSITKAVSSEKLVKKINKKSVIYLPKNEVKKHLEKILKKGDILLIMGAGSIYKLSGEF